MLQYRRRNSTAPAPQRRALRHPMLIYVNWSYAPHTHLSEEELRRILERYDERYGHIYMRIFNEIPKDVIRSFMQKHHIETRCLDEIHHTLLQQGLDIKAL